MIFWRDTVKRFLKQFGKKAMALLFSLLLCLVVPVGAFAEEGEVSSFPEEGELLSSLPEEELPAPEEPSPEPSITLVPSEAPAEKEEKEGEAGLEENEETQAAAGSLLVLGGHKTYMNGYKGALFKPEAYMIRAEVAQMLYNLLASKPAVTESQFSDVVLSRWYGTAVNSLAKAGVLAGYKDGTFLPNKTITRAEFVTALAQCFSIKDNAGEAPFSDTANHWAEKYIIAASSMGWIHGDTGTGRFRPNDPIKRCEAVTVMNFALGRTGDGFAADRETQKFRDVPKNHWAYLQITEAAEPVAGDPPSPSPSPAPGPTDFAVGQSVQVVASGGLNLRSQSNTDSPVITVLTSGTILTVTDISGLPWLGVKTANGTSGFVHSGSSDDPYVVVYTPGAASGAKLSASSLSLHQYQTARLDASVSSGMNAMSWSSSDPSVAVVGYTVSYGSREHGAMVYGKKPGTATLTFSDASGQNKASCTVTVTAPESVRYAYAGENSAVKGKSFDLVAVTDPSRSSVTFTITAGPAKGAYTTNSYTTESRNSGYGLPANTVRVFKKSVAFQAAGTYTVRAVAAGASDFQDFEVFVRSAEESATASVSGERRGSTEGLNVIANFEGYVPEIEDDAIASGNPTVGYGYVVPKNTAFYNNLTKSEAFAMLVDKANNGGYTGGVNRFLRNNGVKMSQAQFDALLSFVWNCGTGTLDPSEYDTPKVMLNAVVPPSDLSAGRPYTGKLNVGSSAVYKDANLSSAVLTKVSDGASVSVVGHKLVPEKKQAWYQVKYGNHTGWMPAGKVTLSATGLTRDLAYADAATLSNNFLQWHKSGSTCIYGLLTRRLAECKVFFFGNYADAYHSSSNYGDNTYGFVYPDCCKRYE